MGEQFMSAGIITAIVLCVVGVVKLPFSTFKAKKPKLYKATFTLLSISLSIGASILTQLFILNGSLISTNFVVLITSTLAGVFGLYSSYEGLGFKNLVKILLAKLQDLASKAPESKFAKYIDKIGIDKALEIVNEKQKTVSENETKQTNA